MKQITFLKSFFLLCALIVGSMNVWAETKPWSGDDPESTLDLQAITSTTMGTWYGTNAWYLDDDYLIVTGYESYKSVANQTWITQASVGSSASTWSTVENEPFQGSSYYTNASYATIQAGRYLLYKVTNLKSLKVYGKNNSTSKYLDIFIYTKSGDDYTKVEEIKYTTDSNNHIWENREDLDTDETYFIYITGVGGSNSRVFEVAFERNSIVDTRENAGLAYAVATQTIAVGNVLDAPELTNPNGLTVTYESGDDDIATVDASGNVTGVSKGTTTITASFEGNSTYKPGSASYTISVTKVMASNSIMYESFDTNNETGGNDGTWGGISTTPAPNFDLTGWTYSTAYGAYQCVRTGKSGSITSPALGVAGDITLKFKMGSWSGDTNNGYVDILNGGTFEGGTDTQKLVSIDKGAWKEFTLNINGVTAATKIKFSDNGNSKRLFIDEVEVLLNKVPATITAAEYATFSSAYATDFSTTGITVYTAEDKETSVALNEVDGGQVPANTPVVLYKAGADGTAINVPVIASATAISSTNDLHVVGEGGLTGEDNIFVLSKKNNKVGFRLWDKTQTLNAGKIYLQGQDSYGARDFLAFDGTTTGIANVEANDNLDANAPMYNLAGQRVNKSYKGVVIVNGKKMLNK